MQIKPLPKYPTLDTPDTCQDTFSGFNKLCKARNLLLVRVLRHDIKFFDPDTGRTYTQPKDDFLYRRFPAIEWFPELIHAYLESINLNYNGIHRSHDDEWLVHTDDKLIPLQDIIDKKNNKTPEKMPNKPSRTYYNDDNIESFADTEGLLYIVKLGNEEETFIKVGITQHSVEERNPGDDVYEVQKQRTYPMMIPDAYHLEQNIIEKFKEYRYHPLLRFSGYTECFMNEVIEELMDYTNKNVKYTFEELF